MDELLKFNLPEEIYTPNEFLIIFKQRSRRLLDNLDNITVEEARSEYYSLFRDCPISLLLNPYGLTNELKKKFPNFFDSTNRKSYIIDIKSIPENEVESFMENLKNKIKKLHCDKTNN